jgi:hypothetical protein
MDTPRGLAWAPGSDAGWPAGAFEAYVKSYAGTNVRDGSMYEPDDTGTIPALGPQMTPAPGSCDGGAENCVWIPNPNYKTLVPGSCDGGAENCQWTTAPGLLPTYFPPVLTPYEYLVAGSQLRPGFGFPILDYLNGQWKIDAWNYAAGEERLDAQALAEQAILVGQGMKLTPQWSQAWNQMQKIQDASMKANADAAHGFVNIMEALPILMAPLMAFFAAEVLPALIGTGAIAPEAASLSIDALDSSAFAGAIDTTAAAETLATVDTFTATVPVAASELPSASEALQIAKAAGNIVGAGNPEIKPYLSIGGSLYNLGSGFLPDFSDTPIDSVESFDYGIDYSGAENFADYADTFPEFSVPDLSLDDFLKYGKDALNIYQQYERIQADPVARPVAPIRTLAPQSALPQYAVNLAPTRVSPILGRTAAIYDDATGQYLPIQTLAPDSSGAVASEAGLFSNPETGKVVMWGGIALLILALAAKG